MAGLIRPPCWPDVKEQQKAAKSEVVMKDRLILEPTLPHSRQDGQILPPGGGLGWASTMAHGGAFIKFRESHTGALSGSDSCAMEAWPSLADPVGGGDAT